VIPVKDVNGLTILARDEHMRPGTDMQALAALKPSFVQMGEMGGFDAVATAGPSGCRVRQPRPPCRQFLGHRRWRGRRAVGSKKGGKAAGLKPRARIRAFATIGSDPALMLTGPVDVTEKLLRKAA
jgi:acetyl-CoA C-acetyltransferase